MNQHKRTCSIVLTALLALVSLTSPAAEIKFLPVPKSHAGDPSSLAEIYVDGDIDEKTLPSIKSVVDKNKLTNALIIFNSEGGNLAESLDIGRYIREKGFSTDVGTFDELWNESRTGECFSACVYSYIGGKYRFYDSGSRFGVHQYYSKAEPKKETNNIEEEAQYIASYLVSYIHEMGVDIELFSKISGQSSNDIELLDYDEMKKMEIFNNGYLEPNWFYKVDSDGVYLIGGQEQMYPDGLISFKCNKNEMHIGFHIMLETKDVDSSFKGYLLLGNDEIEVTDKLLDFSIEESKNRPNSQIVTGFYALTMQNLLKLMRSPGVGFKYKAKSDPLFYRVDLNEEVKSQIQDFDEFCKSNNSK